MAIDDEHWIDKPHIGYDESRYDPEEIHHDCLDCGTELRGVGDRSGAMSWCPECDVTVMMT